MSTPASTSAEQPALREKSTGFGKLLIVVYWVFTISAGARALYQLIRKFDEAPLAISLSALSAAIYLLACVCMARRGERAWRLAVLAVSIELVGVIAIGIFSYIRPELFPLASVWSHFGSGYGYIPLVLPFAGLWWLLKTRPVHKKS